MPDTANTKEPLELDARTGDGLEVRLLWARGNEDVIVEIVDSRFGDRVVFEVAGEQALDAFLHPFAYAPQTALLRGFECAACLFQPELDHPHERR